AVLAIEIEAIDAEDDAIEARRDRGRLEARRSFERRRPRDREARIGRQIAVGAEAARDAEHVGAGVVGAARRDAREVVADVRALQRELGALAAAIRALLARARLVVDGQRQRRAAARRLPR